MTTIHEKLFAAAAIRQALRSKRVSQRQIAERCKVTEAYVSQIIDGKRRSKSVESAIADALGEKVEDVFPDKGTSADDAA